MWGTLTGGYDSELTSNRWVLHGRTVGATRTRIGEARVDDAGNVQADLQVPEDYGEIHDIYLVADGVDVGKGGFFVTRGFSINADSGPVGSPITVTVTGLGLGTLNSTMALRYDNKYTGWLSATTTRGTAVARIRAAGPVGKHLIEVVPASHLTPFMNVEQTSVAYLETFRAPFTVTSGGARSEPALEWPDVQRVNSAAPQKTTIGLAQLSAPAAQASVVPPSGPVGAKVDVRASGLTPSAAVTLVWATVTGGDTFGWSISEEELGNATVAQDGTLSAAVTIPNSLGGWHAIWVRQEDKVLTEAPFLLVRSLVDVTPLVVKEGETFKVHLQGVGWTEMDDGAAVTYDNGFVGYACGFSSNGDVVFSMVATGGPGIHLIDLYPMIFDSGVPKWPWQANMPQLTALEDHPGLGLGYALPIIRVAVEVVP